MLEGDRSAGRLAERESDGFLELCGLAIALPAFNTQRVLVTHNVCLSLYQ
jgi:hypothetical protein